MDPQTKNLHATVGDAEASSVLGRNGEASSTPVEQRARQQYAEKRKLHAQAAAALDACVARDDDDSQAYEDELAKLASDHSDALDALMLLPAPNVRALVEKIQIFHRHRLADGWWRGQEIVAIMACDAERLLAGRDAA
jgi:hypothetical protein